MKKVRLAACAVALSVGGLTPLGLSPAGAEPASAGNALGFGANVNLAGNPVINRAGLAQTALPGDVTAGPEELLEVPVAPLAISGTAVGVATVSREATITSTLIEAAQSDPGPYNARGIGLVEGLDIVTGSPIPIPGLPDAAASLVSADAVRGEAVGVCRGGRAVYSANSETVALQIGGQPVGLNDDVEGLLDAVNDLLGPLAEVVDFERNEPVAVPNGIGVNALHVTVLGALPVLGGERPLVDIVLGHAEVSGLQCAPLPECSDTMDNDGDGRIDAQDPGCLSGPGNTYNPNDDDETDQLPRTADTGDALPRTGGDSSTTLPLAGGLGLLALGGLALRRRSQRAS